MGKMKETHAYLASVEYKDETKPTINGKESTDGMEFVVTAKSYAEAEEKIIDAVTEDLLVKIYGIEIMEAIPLF